MDQVIIFTIRQKGGWMNMNGTGGYDGVQAESEYFQMYPIVSDPESNFQMFPVHWRAQKQDSTWRQSEAQSHLTLGYKLREELSEPSRKPNMSQKCLELKQVQEHNVPKVFCNW